MTSRAHIPGVRFERAPARAAAEPLRTDVAGFVGRARRGPLALGGRRARVERVVGWRAYAAAFGGLDPDADTPYGVRGYFDNGGNTAWIARTGTDGLVAHAEWEVSAGWDPRGVAGGGFPFDRFAIEATSPGAWANGATVDIRYRYRGVSGAPEVDVAVRVDGEPRERLVAVPAAEVVTVVNRGSAFIRLRPAGAVVTPAGPADHPGPTHHAWPSIALRHGAVGAPSVADYVAALRGLLDEPEVALVALPDLHRELPEDAALDVLSEAMIAAGAASDRLILIDPPPARTSVADLLAWRKALQGRLPDLRLRRDGAMYAPGLVVPDPLATGPNGRRAVGACAHVAGVVSRLDRERGAHHTPANAPVWNAVDTVVAYSRNDQGRLHRAGVNAIRCAPQVGLQLWGGRTVVQDEDGSPGLSPVAGQFVAHRRLVHRLVRAIRRTAHPLVFESNEAPLWLALTRAVTTVLVESWRGGGLAGERPEQAFRVRCDDATTTDDDRDAGRVVCEVDLAPAVPMEFITLRVAVSAEGVVEVIE